MRILISNDDSIQAKGLESLVKAFCAREHTVVVSAPARHFVICTCGSPQQVEAVADSVKEFALKECGERPSIIIFVGCDSD